MAIIELPYQRQAFIVELAEDVWSTHSRERQVYLDGVANAVGVSISYGDYGSAFDGLLEHRRGEFHIYVNTARGQPCNSPRARFTLGHELGHYWIDEHRNALLAGKPPHFSFTEHPSCESLAEAEADLFSASLLMPVGEYRRAMIEVRAGLDGIIDLASTFAVSIQSSALRFVSVAARPCAIVMFRSQGSPWWSISPELKRLGLRWMKRLDAEAIGQETATGMALLDSGSSLQQLHQSTSLASAWFRGVLPGSNQDEIYLESAVRLGTHGVLTLLEQHRDMENRRKLAQGRY